jgi:phage portal protein BeeE
MRFLDAVIPKARDASLSVGEWLALTSQYSYNGNTYQLPIQTTMPGQKAQPIGSTFEGYVLGGLSSNGVIFGLASTRMRVFSEARFQFQRMRGGRSGDLFGTPDLAKLEAPWPGGTTGDLLAAMLLHADFAGNAFVYDTGQQLTLLRPDWCDVLLADLRNPVGDVVGYRQVGLQYWHGGKQQRGTPVTLLAGEYAHFAPQPDPLCPWRGMSWLTPVIREIQADSAATAHKLAFFENAATPNVAVSLPKEITPEQFEAFVNKMDETHKGVSNAYKTLYTGGGADVTVIGADMKQLDFKVTQGAGETRIAQAAGVPPVVAGLSEGMQGSSLNAGNFGQARRQFADQTLSQLWRNAAGSLDVIVATPADARLWYDARDIPFLLEDQKDAAEILKERMLTIESAIRGGYTPDSATAAVVAGDLTLLKHTGLFSVQLQPPTTSQPTVGTAPVEDDANA